MSNSKSLAILFLLFIVSGFTGKAAEPDKKKVPVIEGDWWVIASTPDLGKYNKPGQEPVDFGIWQAADGTWQAWSCIRNTACGGHSRLFYRWEGKNLTDANWEPKGISMMADTKLGESEGGLQAPFVLKEKGIYYLFYGDWSRICLASSIDGKTFNRVLNPKGQPDLFQGPFSGTRDPMVLKSNGLFYCYYTGHSSDPPTGMDSCAVFCRTSSDLLHWGEPVNVCSGGSPAKGISWYGANSECPFVVQIGSLYYLFRNQLYGPGGLNTQYVADNPLRFGIGNDDRMVHQMHVAAPEIIELNGQLYMAALNPHLDGIRIAKLKWE